LPPYRIRLSPEYEQQLESWKDIIPDEVVRTLNFRLVDILEHQSAFPKLRSIDGGHLLVVVVEPFAFMVFVTHRDETFYVHQAEFTRGS
jgi:hypothetical protein